MPASRYRPETRLVHAGTLRSQFGETSEALFLTQGYVYESSAQAERRFKNEEPGYQYSRFANPTVAMFEARMAAFEGAEAARATATGMAAVTVALLGQVKAGDHVVAAKPLFGSCRYVVEDFLPRYGVSLDAGRRHRPEAMEERGPAEHQDLLPRKPDQSEPGDHRHRRGGEDRACGRRDAGGRQCVRDAAVPIAARARRGLRRLFGDQAHRRPGPLPRRRGARLGEVHPGQRAQPDPPDRALDLAVQRLGAAQGSGDAERARAPADRYGGDRLGRAGRSSRRSRA